MPASWKIQLPGWDGMKHGFAGVLLSAAEAASASNYPTSSIQATVEHKGFPDSEMTL